MSMTAAIVFARGTAYLMGAANGKEAMGVSREQAAENKRAIIAAAEKLFRGRGADAVGLDEVMKAAGFTPGGFYNHFASKEALIAAVMDKAMESGSADFVAAVEGASAKGVDPLEQQIEWYLSAGHRAGIDTGCPLSGFAGDVRRLGERARTAYARGLASNLRRLENLVDVSGSDADEGARRGKAIALFSEMVGALLLSRAVADADPALSDEILESGRAHLRRAIGA